MRAFSVLGFKKRSGGCIIPKHMTKPMTMADLMASLDKKPLTLNRGDEVKGKIILVTAKEAIVDLKGKNEGAINLNELPEDQRSAFEVGKEITAYVLIPETHSGQTILSLHRESTDKKKPTRRSADPKKWTKFTQALKSGAKLTGEILEQNKGGFVVDIDGVRGFLPSSQLAIEVLKNGGPIGKTVEVGVVEIDLNDNRLILTSRVTPSPEQLEELKKYSVGANVQAKVIGVFPFGVFVEVDGLEGFIKPSDVSWDREEDITLNIKVDQELEVRVVGRDEGLGRLTLSLKVLTEDPFDDLVKDIQVDDVLSGTVTEVTPNGVEVSLKDGLAGFVPQSSIQPGQEYVAGQTVNFLVAGTDKRKHQVLLAPFLTTTAGLLYR